MKESWVSKVGKVPERSRGLGNIYERTSHGFRASEEGREKARGEGGEGELSRDPERSEKSRGRGRGVSPAAERRASGKWRTSASAKTPEHQCSGAQAVAAARAGRVPWVRAPRALLALPEAGLSSERGACAGTRGRRRQRGSIVALTARRRQRLLACGGGGGPSRRSRRLGGASGGGGRGGYGHDPPSRGRSLRLFGGARRMIRPEKRRGQLGAPLGSLAASDWNACPAGQGSLGRGLVSPAPHLKPSLGTANQSLILEKNELVKLPN